MKTTVVNIKTGGKYDEYIGRSSSPYHYGNLFIIGIHGNREEVCNKFDLWLRGIAYSHIEPKRRIWIIRNMSKLKGKILGCFCKPEDCHGDIYAELLNSGDYLNLKE